MAIDFEIASTQPDVSFTHYLFAQRYFVLHWLKPFT